MREVLANYVDRIPLVGEKPSLEEVMPLEIDGFLTSTYPRIVVISRGQNDFWLVGWYDLTKGEDNVLGTMTS